MKILLIMLICIGIFIILYLFKKLQRNYISWKMEDNKIRDEIDKTLKRKIVKQKMCKGN